MAPMIGERAWWLPTWLRRLPTLDVEGAALTQEKTKTDVEADERVPVDIAR